MSVATCPVAEGVPWLDQDFLVEPFDVLARLRSESPVLYEPGIDHYLVTRYDDIVQVLLDRESFSAANASAPVWSPAPVAQRILAEQGYKRVPTLNNADPPRHGPMRKAVRTCMSPRRLRALEPDLAAHARHLVEDLADSKVVDLVADLANKLPPYAGLGLLGIPESDFDQIIGWSEKRVLFTYGRLPEDEQVAVARNVVAFWAYVEDFVRARDAERADDITSDLLRYRDENPDEVTSGDVVNIVYSMALAGHDSTRNLIASGLRRLLTDRSQWDALCADASLIPNAVEEALRFDPPVLGHRRIANVDTSVGGVPVPAGARLVLLFASAHRDRCHFADADALDVRRDNAEEHLSFGKGAHFCLGAPLARIEMRLVLELLTELTPRMRLVDGQDLPYSPNALFRSLQRLLAEPRPTGGKA
jgi:cytochrome P450